MAGAISQFLHNPAPTSAFVGPARRLVEDHYDWEILADRLDRIWTDVSPRTPDGVARSRPLREDGLGTLHHTVPR
jgi:hypothetical protein